jgi:CubicO group peptidase (beta-lactamase class C family)
VKKILFGALALALVAGCKGKGGAERRDPRFDALAAQVELERTQNNVPGVSVALMQDGVVVWAEGFGSKLADGNVKPSKSTLYRIGSCNKMLTATALLRRVDDGTVSLDDPVTMHLPAFHFDLDSTWASSIKVRHLLTHSSGMYDYLTINGPTDDAQLETYLTGTGPNGFGTFEFLMAPAGRFWNYSNPNFYVAGLIDEKVTPGSAYYTKLLHDEVLAPLGMNRTFFLAQDVLADGDYATGRTYDWVNGTTNTLIAGPSSYDNAWARPAGYAWSSVMDEAKFASFLLDGNTAVLSDARRAEMQSDVIDTQEFVGKEWYGYGLLVDDGFFLGNNWYDVKLVNHSGAIPGFSAQMYLVPDTRFAFITLANTDGAYFSNSLVKALQDFAGLPAPGTAPDTQVNPADFPAFAGSYNDPYNVGAIAIGATGGNVTIHMPALDQMSIPYDSALTPLSKGNFLLNVQNTPMLATFILGTSGNGEYFRTRVFVGARQAPFAPSAVMPGAKERLMRGLQEARNSPHPLVLPPY